MVAPLLFMILFAFFYLGAQAMNRQTMRHAAEIGASELNKSLLPISLVFANNPNLTTAFLDWNTNAVNACRRSDNDTDDGNYRRRLAWDWGACVSSAPLDAALNEALASARDRIHSPGFYIGNPSTVQIQVCLIIVDNNGALSCVRSVGTPIVPVSTPAAHGNFAPSFVQVVLRAPGPMSFFGWNPGTQSASAMRQLDRFLAPCPAPNSAALAAYDYTSCGGQQ